MSPATSVFAFIAAVRAAHPGAKCHYAGDGYWEVRDRDLVLGRGTSQLHAWRAACRDVTSFELRAA